MNELNYHVNSCYCAVCKEKRKLQAEQERLAYQQELRRKGSSHKKLQQLLALWSPLIKS